MSTRSILLVEDNPDDAELMFAAIRSAKIPNPVQHVSDGQSAIDYLTGAGIYADRSKYPLPFLVLLDLKLPLVHGFDVLQWIRERCEWVPIVIIQSASAQEADIAKAYKLHANSYVVKPSSLKELIDLLASIKSFWLEKSQWRPPRIPTASVR